MLTIERKKWLPCTPTAICKALVRAFFLPLFKFTLITTFCCDKVSMWQVVLHYMTWFEFGSTIKLINHCWAWYSPLPSFSSSESSNSYQRGAGWCFRLLIISGCRSLIQQTSWMGGTYIYIYRIKFPPMTGINNILFVLSSSP